MRVKKGILGAILWNVGIVCLIINQAVNIKSEMLTMVLISGITIGLTFGGALLLNSYINLFFKD